MWRRRDTAHANITSPRQALQLYKESTNIFHHKTFDRDYLNIVRRTKTSLSTAETLDMSNAAVATIWHPNNITPSMIARPQSIGIWAHLLAGLSLVLWAVTMGPVEKVHPSAPAPRFAPSWLTAPAPLSCTTL